MSNWIQNHRNNKGWRSAAARRLLAASFRRWVKATAWDLSDFVRFGLFKEHLKTKPPGAKREAAASVPAPVTSADVEPKPVIFVSYAVDLKWTGSHRYCGGEKCLNSLVHLLRLKGYEAYIVTTDGKRAGWLADDAPVLSVEAFRVARQKAASYRCVCSWIDAHAFLDGCDKFYYWDMELATSSDYQFPRLWDYFASGRILKIATFSRSIQAWFQSVLDKPVLILQGMVDDRYWKPGEGERIPNRVGYMDEGPHTEALVEAIADHTRAEGLKLDFHLIAGDEPEVIAQMQTCEVFLVTNAGKSPLWGEGGPLGPYEAAACGAVPVCFDLNGPSESIQQNYNGVIVPRGRHDLMALAVSRLYRDAEKLALMRGRALDIFHTSHTMEARWPAVREFLDLSKD